MAEYRNLNTYGMPGGFNITSGEPIDSRIIVNEISQILEPGNWTEVKPYNGLVVSSKDGQVRVCIDAQNYTNPESWKEIGGNSGDITELENSINTLDEMMSLTANKLKESSGLDENLNYVPKANLIKNNNNLAESIETVANEFNNVVYLGDVDSEVPQPGQTTADRAVSDASGNVITETYATKNELENITPTISENSTWIISGQDTGLPSKGADGTGYTKLTWNNSTNANNIKETGLYIIDGVHSNSGDNLPTTAYANGYIGGFMYVTVSTKDEALNEQIIGQNLTLSNKVSGETKQYIRSCVIKGDVETWSAWKEVNTILFFGDKSSGIATRVDIDAAIDNGQYAGVYMDADGFLPQGATFTLTVINNYAATAASSLPSNYRQVTQMFIYTPLSTDGNVNKSVVCKRDGIGGNSISWGELESVGGDVGVGIKTHEGGEIFNNYKNNIASDEYSHAEGESTTASGYASHAEGIYTKAIGAYSHAEGYGTIANNLYEHAEGIYNLSNTGDRNENCTIHSVGIGHDTGTGLPFKNAFEIMRNGNTYLIGIGGYNGTNYSSAKTLQDVVNPQSCATASRPTDVAIGYMTFDTTLNKPIWYKGENVWVDGFGDNLSNSSILIKTEQTLTPEQQTQVQTNINAQPTLVSGTNIKTINGQSVLGSGDLMISGGGIIKEIVSETTKELQPNTFYQFSEVTALTITLAAETEGIYNEYLFQFTSGATATTLSLPETIKWIGSNTIEPNKTYQVSIVNNLAVMGGA